jgi:hypothetical protein
MGCNFEKLVAEEESLLEQILFAEVVLQGLFVLFANGALACLGQFGIDVVFEASFKGVVHLVTKYKSK